jgi:hypothetical protein
MGSIVLLVVMVSAGAVAWADGGFMPLEKANANISIYEPAQRAILAWNGKTEVLILSVDAHSTAQRAKILQFVPLPAKPTKVEEGSFAAFEAVQQAIDRRRPTWERLEARGGGIAEGEGEPESVEVVFHEKIGPHDITVGKILNLDGLATWVKRFAANAGVEVAPSAIDRVSPIAKQYLDADVRYFVFDVIDLASTERSITPIVYEFPTSSAWYPLEVSRLAEGRTAIDLFLITPGKPDIRATRTKFDCASYGRNLNFPVKFTLKPGELKQISPRISAMFSKAPVLTAARYRGSTAGLTRDFRLKVSQLQ